MESAMSNMDDISFEKTAPMDLKKLLNQHHLNLNSTKNESLDNNTTYSKSENKISRNIEMSAVNNRNVKSSAGIDLLKQGKKFFKDNDLANAIE